MLHAENASAGKDYNFKIYGDMQVATIETREVR